MENSARYAREAAREAANAERGRTDDEKLLLRRQNNLRIDGAREAAKAAKNSYAEASKAGTQSFDAQRAGAGKTTDALKGQEKAILSMSAAYAGLQIGSQVADAVRMAWQAAAESLETSREHIRAMTADMEAMRTRANEILAMRGDPRTAGSTAALAGEAAAAGMNTEAYAKFTEEFQRMRRGMSSRPTRHRRTGATTG